jgi:branched-chain amino acid transport system substrate-binding protein
MDDARDGHWSLARSGANARRAAEDSTAIGYIGDLDSGATRTSLPITNQAGIVQISPASTAIDLVRPYLGSDQLPSTEDEGGERTFGRVIPDDQAQAAAATGWARRLGSKRVELVSDGTAFGRTLAASFREAAGGFRITASSPQLLYYAGLAGDEPRAARGFAGPVMASDALLEPSRGRAPARASLATSAAQDPTDLPPAGQRFVRAYRRRYGRMPGRYAAYGYEATALVLDSIRRAGDAGDQRQAVIDAAIERGYGAPRAASEAPPQAGA